MHLSILRTSTCSGGARYVLQRIWLINIFPRKRSFCGTSPPMVFTEISAVSKWVKHQKETPFGSGIFFPNHRSRCSKDFEDWCFFLDSHFSLFNIYVAFVLLFDLVTCHDQQKLHLNDSHATFPKFCIAEGQIIFHCALATFQKTKKCVCFFLKRHSDLWETLLQEAAKRCRAHAVSCVMRKHSAEWSGWKHSESCMFRAVGHD